jgi:hypothetical protein
MSNADLNSRAKSLELDLKSKIKCYIKVGWTRDQSGAEAFMVYLDQRARINFNHIPATWYGRPVDVQLILPPGVNPIDIFPGIPW